MRKLLSGLLLVLVILSLLAGGCGKASEQKASESATVKKAAEESKGVDKDSGIMLGTATTGGFTYLWGTSAATIVNNYSKVKLTPQITAGSGENITRILKGEMKLGVVGNDWVNKYYHGIGVEAAKNLRTIYLTGPSVFHIIVRADSPYKSIYDLKNKKVAIGNKGGGTYEANKEILEALGIGENGIKAQYLSQNESVEALRNKMIDGWLVNAIAPMSGAQEAATMPGGVRFLSVSEEDIQKVLKALPYYEETILKAGTYAGLDNDIRCFGRRYTLLATEDFPEGQAYEIAKALHENYDEWIKVLSSVKGSTLEDTVKRAIAPLHPGVEKYAREVGILK
ncbi:TAXI family TRAP transporter solute-binding subunit [Neomoorella mulderi]|uniref:Alkanesulfonate transporter substrate-binding subunit n=1 Tax=Moorella mulderi DSM 14980 TaxID=1122241 RepID=A0A151AXS9_9FIRM|nr:TAXI family TRAP transporter solute-binding subunit [Moorella mulderi]KYH32207.1 alkanesulfonate transporter substrate-binding subunit [Moorella mulderi DSM 14980]